MSWFSWIHGTSDDGYPDTSTNITFGDEYIDLTVEDVQQYHDEMSRAKQYITEWMRNELTIAEELNLDVRNTLPYIFSTMNINSMSLPESYTRIDSIMSDTKEYRPGSRWLETVVRIHLNVDTTALTTFAGKFLDAYVYRLGIDYTSGTKQDWEDVLFRYPWIPYIVLVQEAWDTNEQFKQYRRQPIV